MSQHSILSQQNKRLKSRYAFFVDDIYLLANTLPHECFFKVQNILVGLFRRQTMENRRKCSPFALLNYVVKIGTFHFLHRYIVGFSSNAISEVPQSVQSVMKLTMESLYISKHLARSCGTLIMKRTPLALRSDQPVYNKCVLFALKGTECIHNF